MSKTLGETFPEEQARLRILLNQGRMLLNHDREIVELRSVYYALIEDLLRRADKAVMGQDLPTMIRIYQEMQEIKR